MRKTVGRFEIDVSQPHPCWITVYYDGLQVMRFSHDHIADLQYALTTATRSVCNSLPDHYKDEV